MVELVELVELVQLVQLNQLVFITLSGTYYIIGRFLLHYRARITVSGIYYIIGWYSIQLNTPITCYTTGQVKNKIILYHTVVRQNNQIDD